MFILIGMSERRVSFGSSKLAGKLVETRLWSRDKVSDKSKSRRSFLPGEIDRLDRSLSGQGSCREPQLRCKLTLPFLVRFCFRSSFSSWLGDLKADRCRAL